MRTYSLLASAKVNLHLEIIGDRPDGYHEIVTIFQSIALADQLQLALNGTQQFRLSCNHPEVPLNETNLAYRAAKLMADTYPEQYQNLGGVDIAITKIIPVAAGLAGGSANAAATLVGIDLLWNLGLTQPELQQLGATLGADVAFCVAGGTVLATGRGEALDPLNNLTQGALVLGKFRDLGVSTLWAYQSYRQEFGHTYSTADIFSEQVEHLRTGPLVNAIAQQDGPGIAKLLHNDLEKVVLPTHPKIQQLRQAFREAGALGALMSGSGPTVFGLCADINHAEQLQNQLAGQFPAVDFWATQFSPFSIQAQTQA
ncbi:MAG: 4-(cytidine 5'-diphospho)-2-C-methyl-D-erythritol kinase [Cyanobacteria bacterium P01_H01_bin.15]